MSAVQSSGLVVVDASLAAMWVLSERFSSHAIALAADWARSGVELIAPCFMATEVANAVYKRVRRRELTLDEAQDALDTVLGFGIDLQDQPSVHSRALAIAHQLDRPTPHDAYYLALAELHDCETWTGDERLYNAAHAHVPRLRWIGTYALNDGSG